jgi:regulator of replication initiation timing
LDINHELILKLESEKNNLMLEKEKMEHSVTEIHQEVSDRDISVDKVRKELESVLVEKEQLTLEIAKLKKVGKGKAAKVAKFEDVVSQQENIISEKEMDMIVLKERVPVKSFLNNVFLHNRRHLLFRRNAFFHNLFTL